MSFQRKVVIIALFVCVLAPATFSSAHAQQYSARPIEVGDWRYTLIQRLQEAGLLQKLHPTRLPYTHAGVARALDALDGRDILPERRRVADELRSSLQIAPERGKNLVLHGQLEVGARAANSDRLDALRPIRDEAFAYQNASAKLSADFGKLFAQAGARHDRYYDSDPDGLDAANRLMSRSESNYLGYQGKFIRALIGRVSNHWSSVSGQGLFVSGNPLSFDHALVTLGTARISMTALMGELDSITEDGRFTGAAGADSVAGNRKRFLFSHRLDFRPNEQWSITILESVVFSGQNAGPSLKYLNPLHVHGIELDNKPKNEENNGLVGLMIWHRRTSASFLGELMLDDFDFLGEGNEKPSIAAHASLTSTLGPGTLRLGSTIVTARAYNSHQQEGSYLYLLRGIGTQFSDYVHGRLAFSYYADHVLPNLSIEPGIDYLAQGEADFRQLLPDRDSNVGTILTGTVERTLRASTKLSVSNDRFNVLLDVGINSVDNHGHAVGISKTRFVGTVSMSLRLDARHSY